MTRAAATQGTPFAAAAMLLKTSRFRIRRRRRPAAAVAVIIIVTVISPGGWRPAGGPQSRSRRPQAAASFAADTAAGPGETRPGRGITTLSPWASEGQVQPGQA